MSDIAITCSRCAAEFTMKSGAAVARCPACAMTHSRPRSQGDSLEALRRANAERAACDFTNAGRDYHSVLRSHPDEHEALWGLVLCRYGVHYVQDERTKKLMPTLYFLRPRPITEDRDYLLACENAPENVRATYEADARYVAEVQRRYLAMTDAGEQRYDIFLCYKGSKRGHADEFAVEHHHAWELYNNLRDNYRVFFAHDTLQGVAGANYEAHIFYALQSAKVMLVVCSDPENLTTPWVHSEWSRYLERVDEREDARLIPLLYDGCNAYALPPAFESRGIQGLRMGELKSLDNLRQNLSKYLQPRQETPQQQDPMAAELLGVEYAMETGDWEEAAAQARALLRRSGACSRAYLYLLLARRKLYPADQLRNVTDPFEEEAEWRYALRVASPAEKAWLEELLGDSLALRRRLEEERRQEQQQWDELCDALAAAADARDWDGMQEQAQAMIAQRPQAHEGYLNALLAAYNLPEASALAGCTEPFERAQMWNEAFRRAEGDAKAQLKATLEESLALRRRLEEKARLAEAERRAEQERQEREACEEAQRLAEEERRREAEKLRAEEEARRAEEMRIQQAKRDEAWQLLKKKKWDEAKKVADEITSQTDADMIRLLARYELPEEKALVHAPLSAFNSCEWLRVMAAAGEMHKKRFEAYHDAARKWNEQACTRRQVRRAALVALLTLLPCYALTTLQALLPQGAGVIAMGGAAVAFGLYSWAFWEENEEHGLLLGGLTGLIAAGVVGLSVFLQLPLWGYLAIALVLALVDLFAALTLEENLSFTALPMLWQVFYGGLKLADQFFDFAWLPTALGVFAWALPAVVALVGLIIILTDNEFEAEDGMRLTVTVAMLGVLAVLLPIGLTFAMGALPAWAGVIALGAAMLGYLAFAVCYCRDCSSDGEVWIIGAILLAAAVCAAVFLPLPQWMFIVAALAVVLGTLIACVAHLDTLAGPLFFALLWLLALLGLFLTDTFVQAPWVDTALHITGSWAGCAVMALSLLLAAGQVNLARGLRGTLWALAALVAGAVGLTLLAVPTYGVVIAMHLLPEWAGVLLLGAAMVAFVLFAIAYGRDNYGGTAWLLLVAVLMTAGAVCANIFFDFAQEIYVYAALALSGITLTAALLRLDDHRILPLPLAAWTLLTGTLQALSHFFPGAWVDIARVVILLVLPGVATLIWAVGAIGFLRDEL